MFIVIVVMAGIILSTALTVAILPLSEMFHASNSQIIAHEIAEIQRVINNSASDDVGAFYRDGYSYPSGAAGAKINLNDSSYRYLAFFNYDRYKHKEAKFVYKNTPNGSVYSHRSAVWFESPFGNFLADDYTKAEFNRCGTGSFEAAQSWCGDAKSLWAKSESHTSHFDLVQSEQHRLYRMSRKFYRYYENNGSFSELGSAGQKAALSSIVTSIVTGSPAATASTCSGVYYYKGMPFGCQDMFNAWGEPIYLHVVGEGHVVLTNSLGIQVATPQGAPEKYVGLAEEINIDKIYLNTP